VAYILNASIFFMKKSLFLLLFFISSRLFAQNASIEGITFDQSANTPLEFASVYLYNFADSSLLTGQVADANGKFKFDKLQSGSYFFKVQFVGYNTFKSASISLSAGQKLNLGRL